MPTTKKPAGWKGSPEDSFWTKETKNGVKYKCPECGKEALGTYFREDLHHHKKDCPRLAPNKFVPEAQDIKPSSGFMDGRGLN